MAVCEYGICMLDSSTSTFSLGQFADDAARSRLRTLLAQQPPVEILMEKVRNQPASPFPALDRWRVWQAKSAMKQCGRFLEPYVRRAHKLEVRRVATHRLSRSLGWNHP